MKVATGIILVLAYPETIVMVADEWYSPYLKYLGIGKKNYVRAGHAALVLINKATGSLAYHDFGRYITSAPNGRVRGQRYDRELAFPLQAILKNNEIVNLNELLYFLATNPKLTHGDGKLIATVCDKVDYDKARAHITSMQQQGQIRYAAFIKSASNCARFVASVLVASVTCGRIKKRLLRSQWFTPSTIGNVVIASTTNKVYEVSEKGVISSFDSSVRKENKKYFLDRLKNHVPNYYGTLKPVEVSNIHPKAQWLGGIAAGAWYELTVEKCLAKNLFRFRRIAPHGHIDIDAVFRAESQFNYLAHFKIVHYSNCLFCTVVQADKEFLLNYVCDFSLKQKEHLA